MSDLLNKEPVKRVIEILSKFNENLKVQILEKTARTAKEAANALNCEEGAIVKSLVFKTETEFLVCLISGDKRCSLNKLKKIISKKDVSMASANDVKAQTGFTIGGVSPVGHINDLNIIIDKTLERFQIVYAAAGHPNSIFKIDISKLKDLTKGRVEDITE
ncbi:YbaK/EbsC family protein [Candidatus Pelagibacter sp.]|nr:YbaK/EbsC family protein [Candidatus Pelagibacter sp.]